MKNKASLVLMELLVMVLVFSLTAAVCLQVFAHAANISQTMEQQDRAVSIARNGAEELKIWRNVEENPLIRYFDSEGTASTETEAAYRLEITPVDSETPGLGQARLRIFAVETGEELFCLDVCWQEVAP